MCPVLVCVCVLVFVRECMCAYVCICVHVCDPFLAQVSCDAWQPTMTVRYGMASVMAGDGVFLELGRMLEFRFKHSLYIFDEYLNIRTQFCYGLYTYTIV